MSFPTRMGKRKRRGGGQLEGHEVTKKLQHAITRERQQTQQEASHIDTLGSSSSDEEELSNRATQLHIDQGLVFQGSSKLTVLEGSLTTMGKRISAGDNSVMISTLGMPGTGIVITGAGGKVKVPLYQQACSFTLSDEGIPTKLEPLYSQKCPPCHLFPDLWAGEMGQLVERHSQSERPLVVVTMGPQGSGKSSFFRYTINSLLNSVPRVGALELDVGQPEFEAPGLMSMAMVEVPLLGAPVTHSIRSQKCIYYGSATPATDPESYLMAVQRMSDWWQDICAGNQAPLVVNTCGWVAGLGELLQRRTVEILKPSQVFIFEDDDQSETEMAQILKVIRKAMGENPGVTKLTLLQSMKESNSKRMEGVDCSHKHSKQFAVRDKCGVQEKSWMYLRWAARCLKQDVDCVRWGQRVQMQMIANDFAALNPWRVRLGRIKVQFLFGSVQPANVFTSLNGAMVGLSKNPIDTEKGGDETCFGLGLVRSVDAATNQILVLTDIDAEKLLQVDVIQVGKLRVPPSLCLTNRYHPPWMVPKDFVNNVF